MKDWEQHDSDGEKRAHEELEGVMASNAQCVGIPDIRWNGVGEAGPGRLLLATICTSCTGD